MDREGMPPVEEYMHEHSDEARVHLELTPATSTRPEELDEDDAPVAHFELTPEALDEDEAPLASAVVVERPPRRDSSVDEASDEGRARADKERLRMQNAKQGARWGAAGSPQIKHR